MTSCESCPLDVQWRALSPKRAIERTHTLEKSPPVVFWAREGPRTHIFALVGMLLMHMVRYQCAQARDPVRYQRPGRAQAWVAWGLEARICVLSPRGVHRVYCLGEVKSHPRAGLNLCDTAAWSLTGLRDGSVEVINRGEGGGNANFNRASTEPWTLPES